MDYKTHLKELGYSDQDADDLTRLVGGSILNKLINKLPFELHYISPFSGKRHNFTG